MGAGLHTYCSRPNSRSTPDCVESLCARWSFHGIARYCGRVAPQPASGILDRHAGSMSFYQCAAVLNRDYTSSPLYMGTCPRCDLGESRSLMPLTGLAPLIIILIGAVPLAFGRRRPWLHNLLPSRPRWLSNTVRRTPSLSCTIFSATPPHPRFST